MQVLRVKRLFAATAIGVLMAGGAAIGAAGTASAAPTHSATHVTGGGWDDGDYGYNHHGWYDDDDDWGGYGGYGGYSHDC